MGHTHHHGIIQEVEDLIPKIEQGIENMAMDARGGNQPYGMQPMRYSQMGPGASGMGMGMGGMGGMRGQLGYVGAYSNNPNMMQMPQPIYVVNQQGFQAQQPCAVQNSQAYGQQNSPYGQGYIVSGDGRPAMVFGGGQPGNPPPCQQTLPQASQSGYQQTYLPTVQMAPQQGYAQSSQQAPQIVPQQAYSANLQSVPRQASPLQSYILAPQPTSQSQQSLQLSSQQIYPPGSEQGSQQNLQRPYSVSPQPAPQPSPQSLQQGYPPASQPSLQQFYPMTSQQGSGVLSQQGYFPPNQTGNLPAELPLREPAELSTPPLTDTRGMTDTKGYPPNSSFSSPQSLRYMLPGSQNLPSSVSAPPLSMQRLQDLPTYLSPADTQVQYEPISMKAHDHHHALKALNGSSHSREALMAILGTYIATKENHGTSLHTGFSGRCSRPEVQRYDGLMTKLESLSHDYVQKHKSVPREWVDAVGPHRRHIFAELYNNNEIVRAFSQDILGGPLVLPELDTYALGTMKTSQLFSARTSTRPSNLNASLSTLSQVRTVVLVDDSGSMTESGHLSWGNNGGYPESRWLQARKILAGIAPLVTMQNSHGIDVHFLNRTPFYTGLRTSTAVESAFDYDSMGGGTPTGRRVNDILDAYMSTLRYYRGLMPLNLIVITDGEANDEEILHMSIEEHVTKIVHRGFPAHQFGIEFVQVGDCQYATRHLEKMEEEVSRHHHRFQRDVVGVTPATRISDMNPEKMLAISVSGIDARLNGYMRSKGLNV